MKKLFEKLAVIFAHALVDAARPVVREAAATVAASAYAGRHPWPALEDGTCRAPTPEELAAYIRTDRDAILRNWR